MYRDIVFGCNRNYLQLKKNQTNTQPKGECQILYRFKKKKTFRAFQHYPLEIPSVNHFISEKAFY